MKLGSYRVFFLLLLAVTLQIAHGAPHFSLVGFAAGVTGGTGERTVKVSTTADFKSNCQSDLIIFVYLSNWTVF
jgi:hypothetical protein